jgi:hypothetical protein
VILRAALAAGAFALAPVALAQCPPPSTAPPALYGGATDRDVIGCWARSGAVSDVVDHGDGTFHCGGYFYRSFAQCVDVLNQDPGGRFAGWTAHVCTQGPGVTHRYGEAGYIG